MSECEGGQREEGPIFKYETQKVSFLPVKMSSFDHTDVLISELQ